LSKIDYHKISKDITRPILMDDVVVVCGGIIGFVESLFT
jgi:hypothetical protein